MRAALGAAAFRAAALRAAALGLAAALLAAPAAAQGTPADSARVNSARVDSVEVAPGAAVPVAPTGPAPAAAPLATLGPAPDAAGRAVSPRPAATAALGVESLLADVPGAFAYALGAPGRAAGVVLGGLAAPALRLGGRPLDDLLTGAPRWDLLPHELVGPLRLADGALGRPLAVEAAVPAFREARPRTELRYLTGRPGVQHVAATHAQTRRAPRALGGAQARLTGTFHVASRAASSPVAGGPGVRHTGVFGRLALARAGLDAEAGALHADRTDGPRGGAFSSASGPARRTLRTDLWATLRARAGLPESATLTLAATDQRTAHVPAPGDTARARATRLSAALAQPVGGAALRFEAFVDALGTGGPLGAAGRRLAGGAMLRDSIALGRAVLAAEGGAHVWGGAVVPSAALRLSAPSASAGVRFGGAPASRLDALGWAGRVTPAAGAAPERALAADVSARLARGPLTLGADAFATATWNARRLVARGDSLAAAVVSESVLARVGATLALGLREATVRGLYARASATALATPGAGASDVARREAEALPRLWGRLRAGARVVGVGGDVLDLDVALDALAWTAFRSAREEPATGALVLPDPGATPRVPARGVVGAEATAAFRAGASLFLRLDHALGELVAARLVADEPLAPFALRFGVVWTLLD